MQTRIYSSLWSGSSLTHVKISTTVSTCWVSWPLATMSLSRIFWWTVSCWGKSFGFAIIIPQPCIGHRYHGVSHSWTWPHRSRCAPSPWTPGLYLPGRTSYGGSEEPHTGNCTDTDSSADSPTTSHKVKATAVLLSQVLHYGGQTPHTCTWCRHGGGTVHCLQLLWLWLPDIDFLFLSKLLWHDDGEWHLIHTHPLVIPHPVLPDAPTSMFVDAVSGDGDKSAKITIESKVEKILAGKSLPPLFGDPYHLPWQFLAFPEEMVCVAVDGSLWTDSSNWSSDPCRSRKCSSSILFKGWWHMLVAP